jgi:large subunit ribosomal protein L17
MARPTRGPRLGAGPAHEKAIKRGLSRSLIINGRIVTTEVKAKKVRPYVEKLVTKARHGGLHNRRIVLAELQDKRVVHRLFDDIAPKTGDRPGGYTRILKLGPRRGDAAPMAILEFVDQPTAAPALQVEEPKRRGRLRGRRQRRRSAEHVHDHDHDHDHEGHDHADTEAVVETEPEAAPEEASE